VPYGEGSLVSEGRAARLTQPLYGAPKPETKIAHDGPSHASFVPRALKLPSVGLELIQHCPLLDVWLENSGKE
jgi:hypothetical protein